MLQPAERLGFLLEAAQQLVAGNAQPDYLERHDAVRILLLGLIDGSHSAFSEQCQDAISANGGRKQAALTPDGLWGGRHGIAG